MSQIAFSIFLGGKVDPYTRFGEERVQRHLSAAQSQQIGKDVVRFCFRYRSLGWLIISYLFI